MDLHIDYILLQSQWFKKELASSVVPLRLIVTALVYERGNLESDSLLSNVFDLPQVLNVSYLTVRSFHRLDFADIRLPLGVNRDLNADLALLIRLIVQVLEVVALCHRLIEDLT